MSLNTRLNKRQSKMLLVILSIFMVTGIILVYRFRSPNVVIAPGEVVNEQFDKVSLLDTYKTYTSEMWRFEIKYPQDWFIFDQFQLVVFSDQEIDSNQGNPESITITVFRNSDVNELSLAQMEDSFNNNGVKIRDLNINGLIGFEVDMTNQEQNQMEAVLVKGDESKPNTILTILVNYPQNKKQEALEAYEQMLTTLRLTSE